MTTNEEHTPDGEGTADPDNIIAPALSALVFYGERVRKMMADTPAVQGPEFRDIGLGFTAALDMGARALRSEPAEVARTHMLVPVSVVAKLLADSSDPEVIALIDRVKALTPV